MLTFMNPKLTKMTGKDKQKKKKKKSKSYEISSTDLYIGEDRDFIIHVYFTGVSH